MAKTKVIKLEAKHPSPQPAATEERLSTADSRSATAEEARRAAKQVVFQSAADMARELIAKSGGNYLAVKFLFEFAGLTGEGAEPAREPSPLLRYYLEGIRNTKPISSEANNEAKSESV